MEQLITIFFRLIRSFYLNAVCEAFCDASYDVLRPGLSLSLYTLQSELASPFAWSAVIEAILRR